PPSCTPLPLLVISALSLHDALPIWRPPSLLGASHVLELRHGSARAHADPVLVQQPAGRLPRVQRLRRRLGVRRIAHRAPPPEDPDRKSTRLNSSHQIISYAVFCFKK